MTTSEARRYQNLRAHLGYLVWSTMQRELLDTRDWNTPAQLSAAIFEWIEAWRNPRRRHTSIADRSPAEFEHLHTIVANAA